MTVGAAGVSLYYAALYTLTEKLGLWYMSSAVCGTVLATVLSFLLQKYWTFRNNDQEAAPRQFKFFAGIATAKFVLNGAFLYSLVEFGHLRYLVAQGILTFLFSTVSFFLTRMIFK